MDLSSSSEVSSNFISSFQTPVNNVKFDCQLAENFGYVYTAESVKEVQNRWQALTSSKFVCIKTTKGYGKNGIHRMTQILNKFWIQCYKLRLVLM